MPAHRFLTPKAPVQKRLLAAMTIPATFMEEGLQVSAYSFRFVHFIGMNDSVLYCKKTKGIEVAGPGRRIGNAATLRPLF